MVYKLATEAVQARNTLSDLKKTGSPDEIKEYMLEHRGELAAAKAAEKYKKDMSKLKLQIQIITDRMPLTADEKRKRIDKIEDARDELSTKFMQHIKQIEEASGKTTLQ